MPLPNDLPAEARAIVEALGGTWRASGGICRCPAHADGSPSLSVRAGERRVLFKCFAGCAAAEVIQALQRLHLLSPSPRPADAVVRPAPADNPRRARTLAARLWGAARPVEATPAACYLASRGLAAPHPEVRYLARTPLGRGCDRRFLPALLVAVSDDAGVAGIQRLFLDPVSGRKRDMAEPRRSLGRFGSGAVRIAPAARRLGLAEGYETARSAAARLGLPVWATLGAARLDRIALPELVTEVVLLPDRGPAGEAAAARAEAAYRAQGRRVELCWPPAGCSDWNDAAG